MMIKVKWLVLIEAKIQKGSIPANVQYSQKAQELQKEEKLETYPNEISLVFLFYLLYTFYAIIVFLYKCKSTKIK
jgi:hypothetical protein